MSDDEIIDLANTCVVSGEKLVEPEQLAQFIATAISPKHFLNLFVAAQISKHITKSIGLTERTFARLLEAKNKTTFVYREITSPQILDLPFTWESCKSIDWEPEYTFDEFLLKVVNVYLSQPLKK